MAKAVVEIAADTSGFDAAVASLPAKMNRAIAGLSAQNDKWRKITSRVGGAGMQLQDIAVQLQMGTRVATIVGQQGSQMLSAFGAGGAIGGAILAIGGALYTMGQNAIESFQKVTKSARDFGADSALLVQSTNADNLSSNLKQVRDQFDALLDRREKLDSYMGFVSAYIGGGSPAQMNAQLMKGMEDMSGVSNQMGDQALKTAKQEVDVARLRAQGRKEEADELERTIKLSQDLAKIDLMRLQDWQKGWLKKLTIEKSELQKPAGPSLFQRAIGGVSEFLTANAAPFKQAMVSRLNDNLTTSKSNTSALASAAFSPLRGDTGDVSIGRGRNVNPLVQGASRQIAEMTQQTRLLQRQIDQLRGSNQYLSSIDASIGKLKFSPTYN